MLGIVEELHRVRCPKGTGEVPTGEAMSVAEFMGLGSVIFASGGIVFSLRVMSANLKDLCNRVRTVELTLARLVAVDVSESPK